jgi:type III secretory pathway component EscU
MNGYLFFIVGKVIIVKDFPFLLDGVKLLTFSVEIVEEPYNWHLRLIQVFILEKITKQILSIDATKLHLGHLISSLGQVGNQVEVLYEIKPG